MVKTSLVMATPSVSVSHVKGKLHCRFCCTQESVSGSRVGYNMNTGIQLMQVIIITW